MNPSDRIILYVAGMGRSGTTLIGNTFGQIEGFLHVGELWYLWDRGLQENRSCGCGVPMRSCPTWTEILKGAFDQLNDETISELIGIREAGLHSRHIPLLITPGLRSQHDSRSQRLKTHLSQLYSTIFNVTGCRVLIDSSKYPSYAVFLSRLSGIQLFLLHVVRDARGVAYSWLRKKQLADLPQVQYIRRFNPAISSGLWAMRNVAAELLWLGKSNRYFRMRYEDFISHPAHAIRSTLKTFQLGEPKLDFIEGQSVRLQPTHTVSGNPMRMQHGEIPLTLDQEWENGMRVKDRRLVTACTWPLLLHYGYGFK